MRFFLGASSSREVKGFAGAFLASMAARRARLDYGENFNEELNHDAIKRNDEMKVMHAI
jgi:hypothetical protein